MIQKQLYEYPPIMGQILATFPQAGEKGVIFSWGEFIYNPSGGTIPDPLIAHEAVHGERQVALGVDKWWEMYLRDALFRFDEELPAHQAEYKRYCEIVKDREKRARYLHNIACRLAGNLYGRCCSYMDAKRKIKNGQ